MCPPTVLSFVSASDVYDNQGFPCFLVKGSQNLALLMCSLGSMCHFKPHVIRLTACLQRGSHLSRFACVFGKGVLYW